MHQNTTTKSSGHVYGVSQRRADLSRNQVSLYDISLWLILLSLAGVSLLHYLTDIHLIPYHSIYRSLYYIPIAVGAVRYGRRGGIATALTASALYIPHIILSWGVMPSDAFNDLLENAIFLFVGAFAGSLADAERRQRQRAQESAHQLRITNEALTQQVDLSERMRGLVTSILESIDSGVVTLDTSGRVTMVNPSAQAVIGATVVSLADMPHAVQQYVVGGARGYHTTAIAGRTYGLHGAPLIGARQEQIGSVLVLDDMTEQRALEEQVQRAQRLSALGRLAGGLAHEIRNPLGITRAAAQMLARELGSDTAFSTYTHVIQTEIDRVDRLIEQLLTYAHPRKARHSRVDASELITQTVSLVNAYAAQHQVQLDVVVPTQLPCFEGDRELLHQGLVNLVLNAVQATPPHGCVTLTARQDTETIPPRIVLEVSDTGCGIAAENLSRIFDPFFTTRDDGTGLGLSIVQQIVHEHEGRMEVTSESGGGTHVTLQLPLFSPSSAPQER